MSAINRVVNKLLYILINFIGNIMISSKTVLGLAGLRIKQIFLFYHPFCTHKFIIL